MKAVGDYRPPQGWVLFRQLNPGDKFHDIYEGKPVQFVKINLVYPVAGPMPKYNAVSLHDGEQWFIDHDEYVYPIDAGWIAELKCYGFEISDELAAQGHQAVLADVMARTEARKADDAWREEITKFFPSLAVMSFAGPVATIRWLMQRVTIKERKDAGTHSEARSDGQGDRRSGD